MTAPAGSIWATLGVAADASETEIRRAYARRLKITRPDDDPDAFQALRDAYERATQIAQRRAAGHAAERDSWDSSDFTESVDEPTHHADAEPEPALLAAAPPRPPPAAPRPPESQTPPRPAHDTAPPPPKPAPAMQREPAPADVAQAALQRFLASRKGAPHTRIAFDAFLREDALMHLAVRDAFELVCAEYCARADVGETLRIEIADAFGWDTDARFVLRALPHAGPILLNRLRADLLHRELEYKQPAAVALFDAPPVSRARAQWMLLPRRSRVAQLGEALERLRMQPRQIVESRFDLENLAFWERQYDGRLTLSIQLSALVMVMWFATLIGLADGRLRLLDWVPPWMSPLWFPLIGASIGAGPVIVWLAWPDRWRRAYQQACERGLFRYGWIVLWAIASVVLLEGRLHDSHAVQVGGLLALLAAIGWAMAAVPTVLEPISLAMCLPLAPLMGTQAAFAQLYGTRDLLWTLIQAPLIRAFVTVQPALSLWLRTHRRLLKLAALEWPLLIVAGAILAVQFGVDAVLHACAPFAVPILLAAAATNVSLIEWARPNRNLVMIGVAALNIPLVDSIVFLLWPLAASASAWYSLKHTSATRAAELYRRWLANRPFAYQHPDRQQRVVTSLYSFLSLIVLLTIVVSINLISPSAGDKDAGHTASSSSAPVPAPASAPASVSSASQVATSGPRLPTVAPRPEQVEPSQSEAACIKSTLAGAEAPVRDARTRAENRWNAQIICLLRSRLPLAPVNGVALDATVRTDLRADGTIERYTLEQGNGGTDWERQLMAMLHDLGQLPEPADAAAPRHFRLKLQAGRAGSTQPALVTSTSFMTAIEALNQLGCTINPPAYPVISKLRGETGEVTVRATLSVKGVTESIKVLHASGYPRLDEAARQAVETMHCVRPVMAHGKPVPATFVFPFQFNLDG